MDINEKRRRVADAYGSSYTWKRRVAAMTDNQVVAIFYALVKQGLIKH